MVKDYRSLTKKLSCDGKFFYTTRVATESIFSTYSRYYLIIFAMQLTSFKKAFDMLLEHHLKDKLSETNHYIFTDDLEQIYNFIIPYSQWWKRIRPYLVYLSYKLHGWEDDALAMQTWIINELIHLFALIHDDITDEWTTRHHLPTYHLYNSTFLQHNETQWKNIALLIWDLILARAYQHMNTLPIEKPTTDLFHAMMHETVCGQIMDVYLSHSKQLFDSEIITKKDHAKSWRYTFKNPLLIGASLLWKQSSPILEQIGELLWLTYQMRDDLFDIINAHGDKTPFSDHQEWNQTFLLTYAYEHATESQKQFLLETRWKPCDINIQQQLLTIYTETGTVDRAKQQINTQLQSCMDLLSERQHNNPSHNSMYIRHFQEMILLLALNA
jgi:geranylgeranyl diphosphate synthase, type I